MLRGGGKNRLFFKSYFPFKKYSFTLSEVLITLVVIGIIAAITVPMILNSLHNQEYKTGYKKAYSDLSNAILKSVALGEFPERNNKYDKKAAEQ